MAGGYCYNGTFIWVVNKREMYSLFKSHSKLLFENGFLGLSQLEGICTRTQQLLIRGRKCFIQNTLDIQSMPCKSLVCHSLGVLLGPQWDQTLTESLGFVMSLSFMLWLLSVSQIWSDVWQSWNNQELKNISLGECCFFDQGWVHDLHFARWPFRKSIPFRLPVFHCSVKWMNGVDGQETGLLLGRGNRTRVVDLHKMGVLHGRAQKFRRFPVLYLSQDLDPHHQKWKNLGEG